jgi:hypothetical protein
VNASLELTIVGADERAPVLPDPDGREVQVWRDSGGAAYAYGYIVRGQHWLHFPGLAAFRFGSGSNEVTAIAFAPVREEAIRDSYRRAVLPFALQALGLEVVHASGILTAAGVVGLCAVSGTGKSTVAYGLSQRGYPLWADDAVAFETSGSGVRTLRLPFKMRLQPDATSSFGVEDQAVELAATGSDGVPLVALGVLERDSDQPDGVMIGCLRPSSAFRTLLVHAYCFSLLDVERKRRMMERYLALSAHLPVFEIRFRPGLQKLPGMLDRIEETVIRK